MNLRTYCVVLATVCALSLCGGRRTYSRAQDATAASREETARSLARRIPSELQRLKLSPEQIKQVAAIQGEAFVEMFRLRQALAERQAKAQEQIRTVLTDTQRAELEKARQMATASRVECVLATFPYRGNEYGLYALPATVQMRIQPRYVSRVGSKTAVDERVTLIVEDSDFWPVIVKMPISEAESLYAQLQRVIALKRQEGQ